MAAVTQAQNREGTARPKAKPRGRPFPPGNNANPRGRPKKDRELTLALEQAVNKNVLAKKLVALATAGDMQAIKYVYDRIDGSPTQRHEVSHDDVLDDVRRMAKERGLSDVDVEWAVKSAEEMMRPHG